MSAGHNYSHVKTTKISLTAHVVIDPKYGCEAVSNMLRMLLLSEFNILHTTLQHERTKCLSEDVSCNFRHD